MPGQLSPSCTQSVSSAGATLSSDHPLPQKSESPWRLIGPGLLMAGAAVGVSHLVQSTRAGAQFGFQLLPLVLLANEIVGEFFMDGGWWVSGCFFYRLCH